VASTGATGSTGAVGVGVDGTEVGAEELEVLEGVAPKKHDVSLPDWTKKGSFWTWNAESMLARIWYQPVGTLTFHGIWLASGSASAAIMTVVDSD
jgi:hypothetical protein